MDSRFEVKMGWSFSEILKRLHARIFNGALVWLSDYDGKITLTVAFMRKRKVNRMNSETNEFHWVEENFRMASRFWPHTHFVILKDDGSVLSIDADPNFTIPNIFADGDKIVSSWIMVNENLKMLMYMQNYQTYSELEEKFKNFKTTDPFVNGGGGTMV